MAKNKTPEEKQPHGRPTLYTEELGNTVCERVKAGETLTRIGRDDKMPCRTTIYNWTKENSEFSERLQHAQEQGFDAWVDECFDIADDGTNDWIEEFDKHGVRTGWRVNGEHIQRSKVRIDMRLKVLAMVSARHRNKTETLMTVSQESDDPMSDIYAEINAATSNPEDAD